MDKLKNFYFKIKSSNLLMPIVFTILAFSLIINFSTGSIISSLNNQINTLSTKISNIEAENESLSTIVEEKDNQLSLLEIDNSTLNISNEELQNKISELESTIQQQADSIEENENLSQRVSELESENAQLKQQNTSTTTNTENAEISSDNNSSNSSDIVHITKTGSKYHRAGCQYLSKSDIEISLESAKAQGYTACSKCY